MDDGHIIARIFLNCPHDVICTTCPNNSDEPLVTFALSPLPPQGHAAPVLYAVWAETGYLKENELFNLRKVDSILEGHPVPVRSHSHRQEVLDRKTLISNKTTEVPQ